MLSMSSETILKLIAEETTTRVERGINTANAVYWYNDPPARRKNAKFLERLGIIVRSAEIIPFPST